MKVRTARVGVFVALVAAFMATTVLPAAATTVKLVVFDGTAQLGGGLGYPCTPVGTTSNCPTGLPGPGGSNGQNHTGFSLTTFVCVKASASTPEKESPKNGVDLCLLTASGSVWGWCGLSFGRGVATLNNLTGTLGPKAPVSVAFTFVEVGGVYQFQGGSGSTTITGTAHAFFPLGLGVGSCTNKTATTLTFSGQLEFVQCTAPVTSAVCSTMPDELPVP